MKGQRVEWRGGRLKDGGGKNGKKAVQIKRIWVGSKAGTKASRQQQYLNAQLLGSIKEAIIEPDSEAPNERTREQESSRRGGDSSTRRP